MAIIFISDLNIEVVLTEEQFREEAIGFIYSAINEKGYAFNEIDSHMIAEDITGVMGDHRLSKDALLIIEEELNNYKNS